MSEVETAIRIDELRHLTRCGSCFDGAAGGTTVLPAAETASSEAAKMCLATLNNVFLCPSGVLAIAPAHALEVGETDDQQQRHERDGRQQIKYRYLFVGDQNADYDRHQQHPDQSQRTPAEFSLSYCHYPRFPAAELETYPLRRALRV
jgi:hypothetical protein